MNINPYEGEQPFIFLSYAHSDWDSIEPILERLQPIKPNIWWDVAINPGDWNNAIKSKIEKSSLFLLALSNTTLKHIEVLKEVIYLFRTKKQPLILPIIIKSDLNPPIEINCDIKELNECLVRCGMKTSTEKELKDIEQIINKQQIFDLSDYKEKTYERIKKFIRKILGITYSDGLFFEYKDDMQGYMVSKGSCSDDVIIIPEEYLGKDVIGVLPNGFSNLSIKEIKLPRTIRYFGDNCFMNIKLQTPIKEINDIEYIGENSVLVFLEERICKHLTKKSIGSVMLVNFNGSPRKVRLIDIDHDDLFDGTGKAHTTWELLNPFPVESEIYPIADNTPNPKSNYKCGWGGSYMKNIVLNTIYNIIDKNVANAIKTVAKQSFSAMESDKNNAVSCVVTDEKLFLLSVTEYDYANNNDLKEGEPYYYYKSNKTPVGYNPAEKILWTRTSSTEYGNIWAGIPGSNMVAYLLVSEKHSFKVAFCI